MLLSSWDLATWWRLLDEWRTLEVWLSEDPPRWLDTHLGDFIAEWFSGHPTQELRIWLLVLPHPTRQWIWPIVRTWLCAECDRVCCLIQEDSGVCWDCAAISDLPMAMTLENCMAPQLVDMNSDAVLSDLQSKWNPAPRDLYSEPSLVDVNSDATPRDMRGSNT